MDTSELIRNEGLRRGLRIETIKTYVHCLNKFFRINKINPIEVKKNDIIDYISQMQMWGKSDNTVNVHLSALKFFYEKVLNKKLTINIALTKTRKRLPDFLTQDETEKLFWAIDNEKHLLIIKLLYSTGMRVGELVKLKVKDFQFNDNYGWVRDGKGGKDRLFVIASKLKEEILKWIDINKLLNDDWLFSGQGSHHYSTESVRVILNKAVKKANMKKNVHPHMLRHSFATHLIQNGYAVTEVQPLLGHNSINTTMIYLHMASPELLKIKSPYDTLNSSA
ncbi:MAG: site-specific tyrosine recombinase/integron integrase [Candidatus Woesearchaeota archaeon]